MIQQVALVWFRPGTTKEQIEGLAKAMTELKTPGKGAYVFNLNAGLKNGTADAAVIATFDDEAAYRAYDTDPEHDRIRRDIARPIIDRVETCQVRV